MLQLESSGLEYMRKKKGKFFNRPTATKGRKYDKFFIYVPTELAHEPTFPFKHGDRVQLVIEGDTLIVKKSEE